MERIAGHIETLAIHAGRSDLRALGVHALPIDLSTTNPLPDLQAGIDSYAALCAGDREGKGSSVYARLHNPTVARFEDALAALEGAEAAVAFGSGMAALTALLLARSAHGRHVVAVRPVYGGTDHLLTHGPLGIECSWVEPDGIAAALRPDTSLVLIETPANPTVDLVDIVAVVHQAGTVPVVVDSTFATPILQNPLALGARFVLHSATKYLGGHGDVVAGVIACSEGDAHALRPVRALTGALLHPLGAYLLHRGLATLPLRIERQQASAGVIARRLAEHPAIGGVRYPGLPGATHGALVAQQMRGPGAMLAFELAGGFAAAATVMAAVRMLTPAVSLGSVDSLIQHPAGITHQLLSAADKAHCGIAPGLLRLSVGLEHPDDIWADLAQAFDAVRRVRPRVARAVA
jgi:methionine-gamma-lyase